MPLLFGSGQMPIVGDTPMTWMAVDGASHVIEANKRSSNSADAPSISIALVSVNKPNSTPLVL
jgi:hypothetical protein